MPCSQVEAEAYVQSVLFPDEPFAKMLMPPSFRKQLRACHGVFACLTEFVKHEGGHIGVDKPVGEKTNPMPSVIIGILLLAIIAAGYVFYSTQIIEAPIAIKIDQYSNHQTLPKNNRVPVNSEPHEEPQTNQLDQLDEQVEAEKAVTGIIGTETTEGESIQEESIKTEPIEKITALEGETEENWFQSMLDNSKNWIETGNSKSGTIQIMSVGLDRFAPAAFEKYLQTLQSDNIDVSQFHIFQTKANDQEIYTIVYGEYPSRREAGLQIKALPKALAGAKPIPRTIGGILREIEKIENE